VRTRALDSWAILEWISGRQPGTGAVAQLLSEAEEGRKRYAIRLDSSNAARWPFQGEEHPRAGASLAETQANMPKKYWWRRRELNPGPRKPAMKSLRA